MNPFADTHSQGSPSHVSKRMGHLYAALTALLLTLPAMAQEPAPVQKSDLGIDIGQLGQLASQVDTNHDGIISQQEIQAALLNHLPLNLGGLPPLNGQSGPGAFFAQAQTILADFESRKMKPDPWGDPDPRTGSLKPEDANALIHSYFEREILGSANMTLSEKFTLIKAQRMGQDQWGKDIPFKGSLGTEAAETFARQAAEQSRPDPRRPGAVKDMLNAIAAERQQADAWGKDDPRTGLLKVQDANALLKRMIMVGVMTDPSLSPTEKLEIIQIHTMHKDNWGKDVPRTGALTADEASLLSRQIFNQTGPSSPSPATPDPGTFSPYSQAPKQP